MLAVPEDPKKIRARILGYERTLRGEKRKFGVHTDGAGKRYLVGPLYMVMGDQDGARTSFAWYEREFPEDAGEPIHSICWALCLHGAGEAHAAAGKLHQAMPLNLYLIPRLLGEACRRLDMWHGSNVEEPPWAENTPPEFLGLWTDSEKERAASLYHGAAFTSARDRWIEIHQRLQHLRPGPERSRLCAEAARLRGW